MCSADTLAVIIAVMIVTNAFIANSRIYLVVVVLVIVYLVQLLVGDEHPSDEQIYRDITNTFSTIRIDS